MAQNVFLTFARCFQIMTKHKIFHFTLGPVQSFVAQARRTRDLWAGSFLLSLLSGYAMKAVRGQEGTIIFPAVTDDQGNPIDPLFRAIHGDTTNNTPQIGTIPNRFKAKVPENFDPSKVTNAVTEKWGEIADAVYQEFVQEVVTEGNNTQKIWDRQVKNFWEINWVIGDDPGDQSDDRWLDMRKNWRSHWPEPEGGDHCTVMGDFQELSGFVGTKKEDKKRQKEFWEKIREKAPDDYLDIRENERLCAIALIKRLFPRLTNIQNIIGWIPGGKKNAVGNWPSTTYMAVAPWLAMINEDDDKIALLDNYLGNIHDVVGNDYFKKLASERATQLAFLDKLNTRNMQCGGQWHISDIDGDLLHLHALSNYRTTYLSDNPLTPEGNDNDENKREKLIKALQELYEKVGARPRSYYALLLMDGDWMGKLLREHDQQKISEALLDFTQEVPQCVDKKPEHSGITIYAGGDDVFAFLPFNTAISCAKALHTIYGDCFRKKDIKATASCAIVYAHHQVPLRLVIQEAHHQLDDIAKDQNGRNSLALAIYKPGGVVAQWVSAWEGQPSPVDELLELIRNMEKELYPRGFFHKLRDRYGFYEDESRAAMPHQIDLKKVLVAEYMLTRTKTPPLQDAEQAIDCLLAACRPLQRDETGNTIKSKTLKLDGGFIARFLTQKEE